ncbi:hypothetical protein Zmor_008522 [Zophobas morio]|uniref:Uncharacterized protein n=1 Tax=Zophobas morio TaxID=2755281 RepID=A0AA38MPT9_9CUCU|nr:hypothetical protein Zmor_008522 [Zophobas morio]
METVQKFLLKIKFHTDEDLWLVGIVYGKFFQTKIFKIVRLIVLASTLFLTLFQTFLFLQRFDGIYFVKYLAMYARSFFVLATAFSIPYIYETFKFAERTGFAWSLKLAPLKTQKQIKLEALYFNCFVFFNTVLTLYSSILHARYLEGDEDYFFPLPLFKEFFSQWENTLSCFYRLTFIPVCFMMTAPFYHCLYATLKLRFEFFLFLDYLKTIDLPEKTQDIKT